MSPKYTQTKRQTKSSASLRDVTAFPSAKPPEQSLEHLRDCCAASADAGTGPCIFSLQILLHMVPTPPRNITRYIMLWLIQILFHMVSSSHA